MNEKQRMTLFCDASLQIDTGASGWGAWALRKSWPHGEYYGSPFLNRMPNIQIAEVCGLANAVFVLETEGKLLGVTSLMLQCDNLAALQFIQAFVDRSRAATVKHHPIPVMTPETREKHLAVGNDLLFAAVHYLGGVASIHALKYELRHIKAHAGGKDGPSHVHRQCDRIAYQSMALSRLYINDRTSRKGRYLSA